MGLGMAARDPLRRKGCCGLVNPHMFGVPMRLLALLLGTLLAGCAGPNAGTDDPPAAGQQTPSHAPTPAQVGVPAPAPVTLDLSGRLWVAPPSGGQRFEASVPFQLNATADLRVTVRVASTLSPVPTANVEARLRDASGTDLARAAFWPPVLQAAEQTMDISQLPAGSYDLHVAAWGGSDGSSGGDHVDYQIKA